MGIKLHYDFANIPSLSARRGPTLDITRTTIATVRDQDGIIRTAQAGEARFTGARRVENLLLQSEDFGTTWADSGSVAITTDSVANPVDGAVTADTITSDGDISDRHLSLQTVSGATAGSQNTISVYVKHLSGDGTIRILEGGDATWHGAIFDLTDLSIERDDSSVDSTSIESLGDGWYRCSITSTRTNTSNWSVYVGACPTGLASISASWDSTGDDQSAYFFGAQLENVSGQQDPAPSEYIATTTAAVARWFGSKRRTNLAKYSEDLSQSQWNKTNSATITGTTQLNFVAEASDINQVVDVPTGEFYTFSALIWSDDPVSFVMDITDNQEGDPVESILVTATPTPTRWSVSIDSSVGDIAEPFRLSFNRLSAGRDITAGESVNISEVQLEKNSTETDYIGPTDAQVLSSGFGVAVESLGLLVEESRENLCLQSEDLSTSWSNWQSTDAQNQGTAPDGANTANKIIADSGGGSGDVYVFQSRTFTVATEYTVSVFLKADVNDWAYLTFSNFGALAISAYFDLTNGAVGATTGGDNTSEFIEDYGNGWYRCGIVFTSDAVDTSGFFHVAVADANGDKLVARDGTSSILVWGAQLEAGAFPTSYIPTTTTSVTRNADVVQTTDVGWLNAAAGTCYVKCQKDITDAGSPNDYLYEFGDGTNNDVVLINHNGVDDAQFFVNDGGVTQAQLVNANTFTSGEHEFASTWSANDFEHYLDGTRIGTGDQSGTVPTITELNIGCSNSGAVNWNGHIKELRYYNYRASNKWLERMSNGIFPSPGANPSKRKGAEAYNFHMRQLQRDDSEALAAILSDLNS